MLDAVLVGLVLGTVLRGKLGRLSETPLIGQTALLGLLVMSQSLQVLGGGFLPAHMAMWVWYVLAIACTAIAAMNYRRSGMPLVIVGLASNLLVVMLNAGMPVVLRNISGSRVVALEAYAALESSWLHVPALPTTSLPFLADVIPISWPAWQRGLVSMGDAMLAIGIAQYIVTTMLGWRPED